MRPRTYLVHGFEGKGGKYLILDTTSASEAWDLYHARTVSGFPTAVGTSDGEITPGELEELADIEERFR